ncbi:MAG: malto-oligosyltrehalose synthase [Gemmatimonadota bacterium]
MPEAPPAPASTYRLQLQPGFGFADAARVAGHLASLGVTHAYLSPVLQAAPGSRHGYDVVDHTRLSADLGGEEGFRAMVAAFRARGLGVVVDVVPNHMAVPVPEFLNQQLWSVLRDGRDSRFAHWFDIDWDALGGRMLLPVLGGPAADCLSELRVGPAGDGVAGVAPDEPVLRYFDHVFPVRPGTAWLPLPELLASQHYRLDDWRSAAASLNWRRFFDVTSLIAVRAEDPDVFAATHGLLLRLLGDGLIDALRIDHPDGLADPRGYLERLAKATGGAWVVAEKILTGGEELPRDWPCAGTTGYDALGMVDGLFTDPAGGPPLTGLYTSLTGGPAGFAGVALAAKRQIATGSLAAEVTRLARLARRAGLAGTAQPGTALGRAGEAGLREVLTELLASFSVYRAYVVPGEPASPQAEAAMASAAAAARGRLPAARHGVLDELCELLLGRGPAGADGDELAVRFQQTCGPLIAKGVEDTAFYRWSRLVSRNEVGGEPDRLAISPAEFHAFAGRLARDWPATMTTLSTHDTKRQEDVRARLAVLAEIPQDWAAEVAAWRDRAQEIAGGPGPEPDTEYLLWQTLAGAWPIDPGRLCGYLLKAAREAKTRTSWTGQDAGYEAAVKSFARAALADSQLAGRIAAFVARLAPDARVNSLGAKLVQLTMPGVPDVYQGCELAGYALVDPDNRHPVDFAARERLLAGLDHDREGFSVAMTENPSPSGEAVLLDAGKLLVTSRALRLRRAHPDWFAGRYQPLAAAGPAAGHAVAFARGGRAVTVATRLPVTLRRAGGWRDTVLPLPSGGDWRDVLTGTAHAGPQVPVAALTARLPVTLLVPAGEAAA